jgi:hypothetical protein
MGLIMDNKSISFNLPNPYQAEMADIARRQKMAELLEAQSLQPLQASSYNGIQAPISPLSGLAKVLKSYMAGKEQRDLIAEQKALGEKYRTQSAEEGTQFLKALRGTPAIEGTEGVPEQKFVPTSIDIEDNPRLLSNVNPQQQAAMNMGQMPELTVPAQRGVPAQPAVGPDLARALQLSMGSINPMVQSAGGSLLAAMTKPKEPKWEKVELPTSQGGKRVGFVDVNAPDPVATFRLGGEVGAKAEYINVGGEMIPRTGYEQNNAPIARTVSPDTQARLTQDRFLADRAFNSLSASQQQQARQEAQRLGISLEDLKLRQWQAQNPAMSFHEGESGAVAFNPRTGTATPVLTPAGTPLQGGRPLTESQSKATGFATRAAEADQILNTVGQGGKVQPGLVKRVGESIPFIGEGVGTMLNVTQTPEQQQVEQAQRNFVNAILRQESGASISPSEFASAQKQYFPQPGEDAKTIAQKAENRRTAIAAMKVQAGPGMQRLQNLRQEEDQAALEWANANPNDPRAAQIKKRLGK